MTVITRPDSCVPIALPRVEQEKRKTLNGKREKEREGEKWEYKMKKKVYINNNTKETSITLRGCLSLAFCISRSIAGPRFPA